MLALPTSHVVAPSILLDCRNALGAFLRVGRDPVGSLRVIGTLLEPLLYEFARSWLMICLAASEAEPMLAVTRNRGHNLIQILLLDAAFDSIDAVGSRAPLQLVFVFDVGSGEKLVVPILKVNRYQKIQRLGIHDSFASILWALNSGCLAFLFDLLSQVLPVAVCTISMAALHGKRQEIGVVLAADVAHETRDCLQAGRAGRAWSQHPPFGCLESC